LITTLIDQIKDKQVTYLIVPKHESTKLSKLNFDSKLDNSSYKGCVLCLNTS